MTVITAVIGNTNVAVGGFDRAGRLQAAGRIATRKEFEPGYYAAEVDKLQKQLFPAASSEPVEGIVLASVVPVATEAVAAALAKSFGSPAKIFDRHMVPGMEIDIENPDELGTDILACCFHLAQKYPLPAISIDMGTATTITAIDSGGIIRGVAIVPGVTTGLQALTKKASLLQSIALAKPRRAIGRNTKESMQSGVVLGTASLLDGMVERFEKELGRAETVMTTGGAGKMIAPLMKRRPPYRRELLLEGLFLAWQRQRVETQK